MTLLLGMDGSVVDVLTGTSVEAVYYGMVESSEKVVAEDGNAAVQTNVTVLCTDGTAKTFAVDKAMDYKAGPSGLCQCQRGQRDHKNTDRKAYQR